MTTPPKPKRHRRTKAEMQAARAEAEHNQRLAAQTAEIEAHLRLVAPERLRRAERTIARWARQARRY